MDERQILVVKLSWSFLNKNPDLIEQILIKKLKEACPNIEDNKKTVIFNGIVDIINILVLNIHSFQKTYEVLDVFVKALENEGCDRNSFNKIVIAFLSAIEKIHGSSWDIETKSSWVMTISTLSYRYTERLASITQNKSSVNLGN